MTTQDFRSDKGRCAAIRRVMEMRVFQQMIEAIFTDLELNEAHLMNHNLSNPTANVEMRLTNQRKGHADFHNAMKMCCEPEGGSGEMPTETYGAEESIVNTAAQLHGWNPVEQ